MNDAKLRAIVREAVARHLARLAVPAAPIPAPPGPEATASTHHVSHSLYVALVNTDSACVIEPAVPCNHCGYCKSHGY